LALIASVLDPRAWIGLLRLVHFYNYSHVAPRRTIRLGPGARLSPTASFRNPSRIEIGARSHIGEGCALWAGNSVGSIVIGSDTLLAPQVFVTASDYGTAASKLLMHQQKRERDVCIGDDVWLGAKVIVVAGVTIGDGCVVGAGSVVTRSLPPGTVAAGIPARVIRSRDTVDVPGTVR
jgi:acetyltransferase-like isoleucine patch superfamily enzyme